MGDVEAARVDVAALRYVAHQYEAVADIVEVTIRARLSPPVFDGSCAGRAHTFHGEAVRAALDDLAEPMQQWARASGDIALALRVSADRYVAADAEAAGRVG